jgi:alpha-L-rhamnosidase
MYEASMNGRKIGDAFLTPGWTSYNKRLQYQAYDITDLIAMGENVIGMNVGSGWYRTPLAWNDNKNLYGKKLGLLLQVNITYSDGSQETVISDNSWKTTDKGPIRFSEIYNGEILDARQEIPGWNKAGFDDQAWQPVTEKAYTKLNLIGTYNEPVLMHESFHPVRIFKTAKGEQIIDFGQNLVGWARSGIFTLKIYVPPKPPIPTS